MTWALPESEHRTFTRNPLEVVICQLRFDPILKVHASLADFQDRIRQRFPRYEEREGQIVELTPGGGLTSRRLRDYLFWARPETSNAVLSDQSLSLEYRDHRSRDDLLRDATLAMSALEEVIQGVSPQRLGLRYVNVIDRLEIGQEMGRKLAWDDLIADDFLRLPGGQEQEEARFATEITRPVESGGFMTVRYGVLPVPGRDHPVFRLDVDRYREQDLKISDCPAVLASFADDIYRLFMSAMGKELRTWMEQQA